MDSRYPEIVLAYNVGTQRASFNLPKGDWAVLADADSSFRWQTPQLINTEAGIAPMGALILGKVKA